MQNQFLSNPPEPRQCFKCSYEAVTAYTICPRCRCPKFLTADSVRMRGILALGVGLFLVVFIGGIALFVGLMLLGSSNDPVTTRKLSQQLHVFLVIAGIFATLIILGLHVIISGLWMVAFGKRGRATVWIMWTLLGTVWALGGIFYALT